MNNIIDQLNSGINQLPSNPWITLISLIFAGLSILLAIYFGIRSLPRKKILVTFENNEILSIKDEFLSKLNITYDEKPVEKLTVSKMIFWNGSFPTINNTDIINAEPFSIILTDGELLDASVLKGADTPNRIHVARTTDSSAQISFDYLDRKEGGIIQIIHTGTHSSVGFTKLLKGGKISLNNPYISYTMAILLGLELIATVFFFVGFSMKGPFLLLAPMLFAGISGGIIGFSDSLSYIKFIPKNCRNQKRKRCKKN